MIALRLPDRWRAGMAVLFGAGLLVRADEPMTAAQYEADPAAMLEAYRRVETGSVTWDDERSALGPRELAKLELPDEKEQIDRIIVRNMPDEGPKGRSR